jgi:nitrite reductase/ring-hydroxylating ferredoxin subunit
MTFVRVAAKKDLPAGRKIGVKADGKEILVVNINGKYFAIGNKCTHMGCKLSDGLVKGENIECICHGSTFDIKSGKVLKGPAKSSEPVFKVKIEGNEVLVEL